MLRTIVRMRSARRLLHLIRGFSNERTTTFGHRTVTEQEKAQEVQKVFTDVARNYDVMNDVMSFGLHRLWKDYLVKKLSPTPGTRLLDVAGGTGDVAYRLLGNCRDCEVTVLDVNPEMLEQGQRHPNSHRISWILGDALALPFPNDSFEAYTVAFGLRNMASFDQALSEAVRVLVPGGRFLCMEFSEVSNPLLRWLYRTYSFELIPVFGELVAQNQPAYQYLVESIEQFPDADSLANMMVGAGLCHVDHEQLLGGIVAIHSGFKPSHISTPSQQDDSHN